MSAVSDRLSAEDIKALARIFWQARQRSRRFEAAGHHFTALDPAAVCSCGWTGRRDSPEDLPAHVDAVLAGGDDPA